MPLPKVHKHVQDQNGNIVPEVLVSVYNQGTGVLATLYQDDAGTVPLSNPMTSDAQYGSFQFYIDPGHYDMTFTKPGYTFQTIYDMQVVEDVLTLGTMATQNANAVAITGGSMAVADRSGNDVVAFRGQVAASGGVNRYNFLADGLAPNYFLGPVGIGTSPGASYALDVTGQSRLNGQIGVGGASGSAVSAVIWHNKSSQTGLQLQPTSTDTGAAAVHFTNIAGSTVGTITCTGSATAYNTSSDVRLKHAVQALTGALDVVRALNPITHLWKSDGSRGYGFLAHEVQATIPDGGIVTGDKDAVDEEGRIVPQQYDPSKLVPWLTAALKEAMAQVDALTARVATLEQGLGI